MQNSEGTMIEDSAVLNTYSTVVIHQKKIGYSVASFFVGERLHLGSKGGGNAGRGGGDGEELESLTHLVWIGQHLIAREQLPGLRGPRLLQQSLR